MRIALVTDSLVVWLAGNPALAERMHSSAGGLSFSGHIEMQHNAFVRGAAAQIVDRGNLMSSVSFTTSRVFSSPAAAETWSALYDTTQPRTGCLVLDTTDGNYVNLSPCVVQPPTRQVIGQSVQLHYTVTGGALWASVAATCTLAPSGANNDILLTAAMVGNLGNFMAAKIATPSSASSACVAAWNNTYAEVIVTPSTTGRMVVASVTSPSTGVNGTLLYAGNAAGTEVFSSDGVLSTLSITGQARAVCFLNGTTATLRAWDASGTVVYSATKATSAMVPSGLTGWTVATGTGSPTITAGVSNAAQGILAINRTPATSAWMTAANAPGNDGTGALAAVTDTAFSGGTGGPVLTDPWLSIL